jgi:hypothetical protein
VGDHAVQACLDGGRSNVELGLDRGPSGQNVSKPFARGPLPVGLLQIAGGDVVRDRVAEDDLERRSAATFFAIEPMTTASSPSNDVNVDCGGRTMRRPARSPSVGLEEEHRLGRHLVAELSACAR